MSEQEKRAEQLISELESIFICIGWRKDPDKVKRSQAIQDELQAIYNQNRK